MLFKLHHIFGKRIIRVPRFVRKAFPLSEPRSLMKISLGTPFRLHVFHRRLNQLIKNPSAPRLRMHHSADFHFGRKKAIYRQETDNPVILVK